MNRHYLTALEIPKQKLDCRLHEIAIRLFDVLLSLLFIIVLLPAFCIIGLSIVITMGFPILFIHERYGHNKRIFKVFKFRSMQNILIAETENLEKVNDNENAVKFKNDPRITKLGSFLRKTSLDELPQLFNILAGDMSFVGPRPFIMEECVGFSPEWFNRLDVKPGLTGLAQINGRDELSLEEIIEFDLHWNKNYSLKMYFLIMLRTVPYVFKLDGY